jgi:hypothetical protein
VKTAVASSSPRSAPEKAMFTLSSRSAPVGTGAMTKMAA